MPVNSEGRPKKHLVRQMSPVGTVAEDFRNGETYGAAQVVLSDVNGSSPAPNDNSMSRIESIATKLFCRQNL